MACEADQVTPSYVNYVEVVGEEGNIFASILDGLATLRFVRGRGWEPPRRFGRVDLVRRELEHFVSCLARGAPAQLNTADESVKLMEVVDEVRRLLVERALPRA